MAQATDAVRRADGGLSGAGSYTISGAKYFNASRSAWARSCLDGCAMIAVETRTSDLPFELRPSLRSQSPRTPHNACHTVGRPTAASFSRTFGTRLWRQHP